MKKFILVIAVMATGIPALAQPVNTQILVAPPQGVFVSQFQDNWVETSGADTSSIVSTNTYTINWQNGQGGSGSMVGWGGWVDEDYTWAATSWPQVLPGGTITYPGATATNACYPPSLGLEQCNTSGQDPNVSPGFWQDTSETAQTEMKLATGGPLGSTAQNLWVISTSATDATTGQPIPSDQISIGGLGNLDTNGNLYVLLPDGDPDITPMVAGISFFTWQMPTATEYPLAITVNGIALSNNVVAPGADFCVGQGLTFGVTGLAPYRHQNDDHAVWKLPGTFVNTNSDPNCDLFYEKNTALINPPVGTTSTHCWYVLDGQQMTVSVTVYYDFSDTGAIFSQTITGIFNVHRPTTAPASPYQPDGAPTARILGGSLSLGVSGVANDMSFAHTITTDGFCAGQAGYVQLITSADVINANPPRAPLNVTALDAALGEFPADRQSSVPANTTTTLNKFYDAPAAGLPSGTFSVSEDVSFSTYLMFQPPGGIWVPLRLITWELHDHADPTWTPYNSNDGNTTKITDDKDRTDFPHWTTTW